jgi:hypothetical protein
MAKSRRRKKAIGHINTSRLVLSTGEAHPPFFQELSPGVVEKCVWDNSINAYRCSIVHEHDG